MKSGCDLSKPAVNSNVSICESMAVGCIPMLRILWKKLSARYPLYIVSNCQDGYIEAMFAVHDLQKYFRDYECSGDVGKAKFENLKSIVERNHLQQPVYIGDTKTDQISCCKAGIPLIYASFGFGEADDYAASVDTFSKLAQLFLTETIALRY